MSKKVLIVDDDPNVREMIQVILLNAGHTVVPAENPDQALVYLETSRDEPFELIISDMNMPGSTGLDFLGALKRDPSTVKIPFVMLTSESQTDIILSGYEKGADYYMTKPFTRAQLLQGLSLVLDGKGKMS